MYIKHFGVVSTAQLPDLDVKVNDERGGEKSMTAQ
jgi:hypothetical protein